MITTYKSHNGVTLVELLAAMIVAGFLLSAAIPAFMGTIGNNSSKMEANRALMDIQLARSEAIKRGKSVYICIADAEACDPANPSTCRCGVDVPATRYDMGWLIFVDEDKDKDFDADTELLLFVGLPPDDVVTMVSNGTIKYGIGLQANGQIARGDQNGKIAVCYDGESSEDLPGRRITISMTGRTTVKMMDPGESCTPGD